MRDRNTRSEAVMSNDKLPFTAHLVELRRRILVFVIALFVGFAACFHYSESIFRFLMLPIRTDMVFKAVYPFVSFVPKESALTSLVFLAPAEAFWAHLKIAMVSGLMLSIPVLFLQIWRFVSPGLLEKEKKYAFPFVSVGSMLFMIGASFCFFIVLPFAMGFLLTYKTASLTPMISVNKYIDFCLKFLLAFGIIFELPVVIVFLTRLGIVTPRMLSKNRKYAVLLAFVIAALLTPTPDAFNQTLMAVPIIFLYEGGIIASRLFTRRKKENDDKGEES
jgi:sec-independent protein translocase protein TatC